MLLLSPLAVPFLLAFFLWAMFDCLILGHV
jgi:hypothetical protein